MIGSMAARRRKFFRNLLVSYGFKPLPLVGAWMSVPLTFRLLYPRSTNPFFGLTPVMRSCWSRVFSSVLLSFGFPRKFTAETITLLFCDARKRNLAAKLIFFVSLSFGYARNFQGVKRVNLVFVVSFLS